MRIRGSIALGLSGASFIGGTVIGGYTAYRLIVKRIEQAEPIITRQLKDLLLKARDPNLTNEEFLALVEDERRFFKQIL